MLTMEGSEGHEATAISGFWLQMGATGASQNLGKVEEDRHRFKKKKPTKARKTKQTNNVEELTVFLWSRHVLTSLVHVKQGTLYF